MSFRRRIAGPAAPLLTDERANGHVIWLSGQSSSRTSALSPEQEVFLNGLASPELRPILSGLPFDTSHEEVPHHRVFLPAASIRNGSQFLIAAWSRAFLADIARHLQRIIDLTESHLVIVCGSCGFQFLQLSWPLLAFPRGLRLLTIGLGPVGRSRHEMPEKFIIVGKRDPWSRYIGPTEPPDFEPDCGHLDYASDEMVINAVRERCRNFTSPSHAG